MGNAYSWPPMRTNLLLLLTVRLTEGLHGETLKQHSTIHVHYEITITIIILQHSICKTVNN